MGREPRDESQAATAVAVSIAVVSAAVTLTRGPVAGLVVGVFLVGAALLVVGLFGP